MAKKRRVAESFGEERVSGSVEDVNDLFGFYIGALDLEARVLVGTVREVEFRRLEN